MFGWKHIYPDLFEHNAKRCRGYVKYRFLQFSRLLFNELWLHIAVLQWPVAICITKGFHSTVTFMLCIARAKWKEHCRSTVQPWPDIEDAPMDEDLPSSTVFQTSLENICLKQTLVHSSVGLQYPQPWVTTAWREVKWRGVIFLRLPFLSSRSSVQRLTRSLSFISLSFYQQVLPTARPKKNQPQRWYHRSTWDAPPVCSKWLLNNVHVTFWVHMR